MGRLKSIIKDRSKLNYIANESIIANEELVNKTIEQIKKILYKNKDMVALSAPQIGTDMRLFCLKFNNGDIRTFINPLIIKHSNKVHLSVEGNESIDGEYLNMRFDDIDVSYQTPVGSIETNRFSGAPSDLFQQMVNCLDDIYINDIGLKIIPEFYKATQEERNEVIKYWLLDLVDKGKELNAEINSNEELKKISDAIDFMTGVSLGKIQLEKLDDKEVTNEQNN